jgi:hypothetical protein
MQQRPTLKRKEKSQFRIGEGGKRKREDAPDVLRDLRRHRREESAERTSSRANIVPVKAKREHPEAFVSLFVGDGEKGRVSAGSRKQKRRERRTFEPPKMRVNQGESRRARQKIEMPVKVGAINSGIHCHCIDWVEASMMKGVKRGGARRTTKIEAEMIQKNRCREERNREEGKQKGQLRVTSALQAEKKGAQDASSGSQRSCRGAGRRRG